MNENNVLGKTEIGQGSLIKIRQTPLQQAYQIGSAGLCEFSCPAYFFQEYVVDTLDVARLRFIVERIVERNEALQSVSFGAFGLPTDSSIVKKCFDFIQSSEMSPSEFSLFYKEKTAQIKRDWISYQKLYIHVCFNKQYYVSVLYHLSACDAASVVLIQNYLRDLYVDPDYTVKISSYEAYIAELYRIRESEIFLKAKAFWQKKIPDLSPAPQLPYTLLHNETKTSRFQRLTHTISEEKYQSLHKVSIANGLSINSLLFTVYCDVLRAWSQNKNFTINVMIGRRELSDAFHYEGIGNCSSTLLMESKYSTASLIQRARVNYVESLVCYNFLNYTGVEVIRDYADHHNLNVTTPIMPVVFASLIGVDPKRNGFVIPISSWRHTRSTLSTPQVFLDHQVYDDKQGLTYTWDFVETVFPTGLVETMFGLYNTLIDFIASTPDVVEKESDRQYKDFFIPKHDYLPTTSNRCGKMLHDNIYKAFERYPNHPAIQSDELSITFSELERLVGKAGCYLRNEGVTQGKVVAILSDTGYMQIVAVLAILTIGCTYLPIDKRTPQSRIEKILARSDCHYIISDSEMEFIATKLLLMSSAFNYPLDQIIQPIKVDITEPAYIIFTSGSTGEPKGVSISHESAVNTIDDVSQKFKITNATKAIALSALGFDLSVYDIFGVLGAGGTLVYPKASLYPDPGLWLAAVKRFGVTLWNSVPTYMEMLIRLGGIGELTSLKTIMLSGDWVKKDLVDTIHSRLPEVNIVAMGGATEASIWSNYFLATQTAYNSVYVPYGYPLANQYLCILDEALNECFLWKEGDIYIGGSGLAIGYVNDREKTNAAFIIHPKTQQRLYKTGDRGCYMHDRGIQFLGRKDFQIKIRGYRIELGEIDSIAESHHSVSSAIAFVVHKGDKNAFIVLGVLAKDNADLNQILAYVSSHLPDYMHPKCICKIDKIPTTANGKIDRDFLASSYVTAVTDTPLLALPKNACEAAIYEIWQSILHINNFSTTDRFFDIGGNSVAAIDLIVEMEKVFSRKFPAEIVFQHQTITELAVAIEENYKEKVCKQLSRGERGSIILLPPVSGNLLCYETVLHHFNGFNVYGLSLTQEYLAELSGTETIEKIIEIFSKAVIDEIFIKRTILCGWSMGGTLAYGMSSVLERFGIEVSCIHMVDSYIGKPAAMRLNEDAFINLFFSDILNSNNLQSIGHDGDVNTRKYILENNKQLGVFYENFKKNYLILLNSTACEISYPGAVNFYQADQSLGGFPGLRQLPEVIKLSSDAITAYPGESHFSIFELAFRDIGRKINANNSAGAITVQAEKIIM